MKIYKSRPNPRQARKVWDHITREEEMEPLRLWYNQIAWGIHDDVFWDWWIAELPDGETMCILPYGIG